MVPTEFAYELIYPCPKEVAKRVQPTRYLESGSEPMRKIPELQRERYLLGSHAYPTAQDWQINQINPRLIQWANCLDFAQRYSNKYFAVAVIGRQDHSTTENKTIY